MLSITESLSEPPFHLPGYTLIEQIYQGSRTEVYRAMQTAQQRPVVIKVLRREYPSFSELVQFRNQFTLLRGITDAHKEHQPVAGVIQPLSLEPLGKSYALVMEDFGGISLNHYAHQRPLEVIEVLAIAVQIAEILHELHQHRIVHKDLKPANILIHPDSKQVKLIDFSIASLLPRETQEIQNPNQLEGTLTYLAPEQTGRMNRGIDYRADFYALGVTLYQLLTGQLPFQSDDVMELIYCHLAKRPAQVHHLNPSVPPMLSEIVFKLMAKNAEDRYQSAIGLKHDLEHCLHEWQDTGNIADFRLGQRDLSDRFLIPEKLYGREAEVQQLLAAFERVANGKSELMLVAGFSGIGKTAVVNEVHKPIVRQRGYFIKGKYDQFNRNIPLSAFVQALRDLMGQLLSESDAALEQWKNQILTAVGNNGQVLIDVIPELEQIIGKQPAAPELSGSAVQNRFNLLFQKFIEVFTTPAHPLIIFLDDLQWADSASLQLVKLLMNDNGYLLMLGAYRDNEVSPVHPFILTVEELKKAQKTVNTITLLPLTLQDMSHLVADTLACSTQLVQPLTELIDRQTQGNPFFITQFLKATHTAGHITFNQERCYWECDIAQISAVVFTDDVVDFMAQQLQKLPPETQNVLKLAACVGNQFDLNTLAIVSQQSQTEAATALWRALQEGLIIPISETYKFFQSHETQTAQQNIAVPYKFLHDRVQQAAYSLIPETLRKSTHFQIGKLLLADVSLEEQGSKIFAIVNHLNQGFELHRSQEEHSELLQLNCLAGTRAKESTAYGVAVNYFTMAESLLPPDSWQQCYEKSLEVYFNLAEAKYLSGDFSSSMAIIETISSFARQPIERAEAFNLAIQMFTLQGKYLQALEYGQKALSCLNFDLSEIDLSAKLASYQQEIQIKLANRQPEQLVNEPEATAPDKRLIIKILNNLIVPVYVLQKPELYFFVALSMVAVSLNFGVIGESGNGFSAYGMYLGYYHNDYQSGYEFGVLAESLAKRFRQADNLCKACYMLGNNLLSWVRPLRCSLPIFDQGLVAGLQSGEMVFSGNLLMYKLLNSFYAGDSVLEVQQNLPEYLEFSAKKLNYQLAVDVISGLKILLPDLTANLTENLPTEEQHLEVCKSNNSDYAICHYLLLKTQVLCFYGRYAEAVAAAEGAEDLVGTITGKYQVAAINFYQSIAIAEYCRTHSLGLDNSYIQKVKSNQAQLSLWAVSCPENFAHKCALVNAILSILLGQKAEAIELFDRAISGAKINGYLQEEALANELAAKFYLEWGKEKIAASYLQEAYYCYARWGANAKVNDLEQRYPQLLRPILQAQHSQQTILETLATISAPNYLHSSTSSKSSASSSINTTLDFATLLQTCQILSSTIDLDELLSILTQTMLQNSGADKCALILCQHGLWQVRVIADLEQTTLQVAPLENNNKVPAKLIQYVKNTMTTVVVDALETDLPVVGEYLHYHQPQSVLCIPILRQGNLVGILYLENQTTRGVFTSDRILVLNFLCTEAAISLENARLYQQAQTYAQQLEQSQLQIVQSEKMASLGNLVAGVAHEINNPIGFLNGSIKNGKDYLKDLLNHLALYQEYYPNPVPSIQDNAEDIDIDYLIDDLPKLLDSMEGATNRIKTISISLRTFSRADTEHKVSANLHEGLDSTLLILKYRLKANEFRPAIQVAQNYGELPAVECFPGQLNQVFLNILANAIDMFDEVAHTHSFEILTAHPQTIIISTEKVANQVIIRIRDNGKGMSQEVQAKIFDHLFTTKAVGKGTGLGLAIARQIVVEKHNGKLEVQSAIGQGSEFCISIPLPK
ncbi:serine/threonine protein kinase with two-component sensor domain [Tolypothrix tenuis PCC 7101]|uniref:histidine kinase n=1 Tax=Tolypothrix tenuis PCC 7101 TaxID=231146 RepID=A0A1Z4MZR8_9CYAN|nr:AAA family ATPase [Aulosira sp. FACHB-113]BAY98933.1 serine/threonine protein kinase with two-component sensor domain [Tolypothrix tenuis PCC 7101]BAZ77148.1 serine/threonine protein kinase with two-component sensor domain [Aulosira laxa NIES-50]